MGRRIADYNLFDLIKNFLTIYLPIQRKASENTVATYRIALDQFISHVSSKNKIAYSAVTHDMFSRENVDDFLTYLLSEKNVATSTRNNRLASIKAFLKYAAAFNAEYLDILNSVNGISVQKDDPFAKIDYLSEAAIKLLFDEPDIETTIGQRDRFLMILLYDTGARIQELLDIKICDIKVDDTSSVTLKGKGGRIRVVPLMKNTVKHLTNYMRAFHKNETIASQEYLFYVVHTYGRTKMCDDTVRRRLTFYAKNASKKCSEIPESIHPHLFRHSRAMHLYQRGMPLELISQWLGHRQLTTTLVYAHADVEQKRQAIEKAMMNTATINVSESIRRATKKLENDSFKKLYGLK